MEGTYRHSLQTHFLEEHLQAERQLNADRAITLDVEVAEYATQLESYSSPRQTRLDRLRYRQRQAELKAAYKEFDEAAGEVCVAKATMRKTTPMTPTRLPATTTTKLTRPRALPSTRKSSAW